LPKERLRDFSRYSYSYFGENGTELMLISLLVIMPKMEHCEIPDTSRISFIDSLVVSFDV